MADNLANFDFAALVDAIRQVDGNLVAQAGRAVNISLTLRNWLIGAYIAEYELCGADRASYGENLLTELAKHLTDQKEVMGESDLEDGLLDKIQDFLLELGHGFCFEA